MTYILFLEPNIPADITSNHFQHDQEPIHPSTHA